MLTSEQLLMPLAARRTDEAMVTAMSVVRPWGRLSDHDLDFASADAAMGHSADLALGIAMAQPDRKVVCLNGDGSMLMCLGTLATIVEAGAENMILFVVVNGAYEITGNQPIPGAGRLDFAGMARAAGFARVFDFDDAIEYESQLDEILTVRGPTFVAVHVEPGSEGPISRSNAEPARYLKVSLAEWSLQMRRAMTSGE